jgi:prepilin-type processing-associated H-X9-DG protein
LVWSSYDGANRIMVFFAHQYVKSAGIFRCPADRDPPPSDIVTADQTLFQSARMSYEFYFLWWPPEKGPMLARLQDSRSMAPLTWDVDGGENHSSLKNHKGGGNVLFVDGHAAWQPTREWEGGSWPSPASRFYPR